MRRAVPILVSLLLFASAAPAQYLEQGDREIQFTAMLFSVSGTTTINLSGLYGYYKTDQWEIGGGPSLTYFSYSFGDFGDDEFFDTDEFSGSETTFGFTAFTRYLLETKEQLSPYLSVQWYQYDISPPEPLGFADMSYLQFGGGFKYFLNEYIAYDVAGNFGFSLGGGDISFLAVAGVSAIF